MPGVALDTNILVYAAGLRRVAADEAKTVMASALIATLTRSGQLVVAAQALAELRHVLVRAARMPGDKASRHVARLLDMADCIATSEAILRSAFELAARHKLQTYDAIILAAAAAAECELLLSEDMQHGFEWEGVRIVNPFV